MPDERHDQRTGAIFFNETKEERELRTLKEEFPLMKKAILILLRKYPGPLPSDLQRFLNGDTSC